MAKVYLAGGMVNDWRSKVKEACPNHTYYDPCKDTDQRFQYTITQGDLQGVQDCDIVFAYRERDNPQFIGASIEIGYATALGKRVYLVDEHKKLHGLLCSCTYYIFTDFDEALSFLVKES